MNRAVTQMDEVTQQNAALVEEAAAAAQSMAAQASNLKELVSFFRVGAGQGPQGARAAYGALGAAPGMARAWAAAAV
ncbi:hypothetical protein [Paraburkholderia sp. JHI869]|uniref:hypothetical protein n=1 Tax=Paraburkholderia sp. JHI869 TaxID=3112959 RepID=UPI00317342E5